MNLHFQDFQHRFTQHLRNPQKMPRPEGVSARRMEVYNELVYNNIEDVLAGCFPVLKLVLGKRKWERLVRDFFSDHICRRPFYRQVPDEFVEYLQKERGKRKGDSSFLADLAHYEWMELFLFLSEEKFDPGKIKPDGDLLEGQPAFAPALALVFYPFPVHRIGPGFKPRKPSIEPFYYLLYRNQKDEVQFILLNRSSARLVDLLLKSELTGREAILKIVSELKHSHPEIVLEGGLKTLTELHGKQAILGTRKT